MKKETLLDKLTKYQLGQAEEYIHYATSAIIGHRKAIAKRLAEAKRSGALFLTMKSGVHRAKLEQAFDALDAQGVTITKDAGENWRIWWSYTGKMSNVGKVEIEMSFNNNGPTVTVVKRNENNYHSDRVLEIKWSTKQMFVYNRSLDTVLQSKGE